MADVSFPTAKESATERASSSTNFSLQLLYPLAPPTGTMARMALRPRTDLVLFLDFPKLSVSTGFATSTSSLVETRILHIRRYVSSQTS
jgi:hypothetical protein